MDFGDYPGTDEDWSRDSKIEAYQRQIMMRECEELSVAALKRVWALCTSAQQSALLYLTGIDRSKVEC